MNVLVLKNKWFYVRIMMYLLGMFFAGGGVNLILRSTIGAGSWDAVNDHSQILFGITLGTASLITNFTILTFILIYRKNLKYLIVIIPIFGIATMMDIWDIVILNGINPTGLFEQILWFVLGSTLLPFGLSLMITTKFPSMVYDEMTFAFMEILHINNFFKVRVGVELLAVLIAITQGLVIGIGLGSVSIGTAILAITIGPMIDYFIKLVNKIKKEAY
ncbi:MAG: hypothetical protein O2987_02935 [Firmicutes bacterium]|nr:hypothetical protein [Bacillota bacterium]